MGEESGMGNFQSLREVMERIAALDATIVCRLETLAAAKADSQQRDSMVLKAVAARRKNQLSALEDYLRHGPAELLETYYQYTPEVALDQSLLRDFGGHSADDVLEALSRIDDVIAHVYEELTRRAEFQDLRQVLEGFSEQLAEQQRQTASASQAAYDT